MGEGEPRFLLSHREEHDCRLRGCAAADNGVGKRRAGDGGRARAEAQGPGVERAASCYRVAGVQSPWRRCWPPAADALEALTEVCPA